MFLIQVSKERRTVCKTSMFLFKDSLVNPQPKILNVPKQRSQNDHLIHVPKDSLCISFSGRRSLGWIHPEFDWIKWALRQKPHNWNGKECPWNFTSEASVFPEILSLLEKNLLAIFFKRAINVSMQH